MNRIENKPNESITVSYKNNISKANNNVSSTVDLNYKGSTNNTYNNINASYMNSVNSYNSVNTTNNVNAINLINEVQSLQIIDMIEQIEHVDNTPYYEIMNKAFALHTKDELWQTFLGADIYRQVAQLEQNNKAKAILELINEQSEKTEQLIKAAVQIASQEITKNNEFEMVWLTMFQNYPQFKKLLTKEYSIVEKIALIKEQHIYTITVAIITQDNIKLVVPQIITSFNATKIEQKILALQNKCMKSYALFNEVFYFNFYCHELVNENDVLQEFKDQLLYGWGKEVINSIKPMDVKFSNMLIINKK